MTISVTGAVKMREIKQEYELDSLIPDTDPGDLGDPEKLLTLDIETTGLSRQTSYLYLIGMGTFSRGRYTVRQWFADLPEEEELILKRALDFSKSFETLLHYNGERFDLPFLKYKAEKYKTAFFPGKLKSTDIYREIKPCKKLLGLNSLSQRDIERFLGIERNDPYTGRELIRVYMDYKKTGSEEYLRPLLLHNLEDVLGIVKILPILKYARLKELKLEYVDSRINSYKGFDGFPRREVLLEFRHGLKLPGGFKSYNEGIFASFEKELVKVRVPVEELTLKHFYENFRDYYYLPVEDTCIPKSIGSGVEKQYRENARKDTCYTKVCSEFVPAPANFRGMTLFKREYGSDREYVSLEELKEKEALSRYGTALLKAIIS